MAYDPDGRVGALYGVAVCPMVELAERGGIVRDSPHRQSLADRGGAGAQGAGAAERRVARGLRRWPAPVPQHGFVDPLVAAEFPGLRLRWVTVRARPGPSPPALRAQLRDLSNRYRGGGVVAMRTKPIPQAFRAFFRQIGLDPDVRRIPSEEVAVARLVQGGLHSVDLVADACLVALVETGVPVWALDADRVDDAGLGIRVAAEGSLIVGDGDGMTCCALFERPAARMRRRVAHPAGHAVRGGRRRRPGDPRRGGAVVRGGPAGAPRCLSGAIDLREPAATAVSAAPADGFRVIRSR